MTDLAALNAVTGIAGLGAIVVLFVDFVRRLGRLVSQDQW
jgi:hypothetical protein